MVMLVDPVRTNSDFMATSVYSFWFGYVNIVFLGIRKHERYL